MVSWAGLLFVRKTYCLSCNGLAEDNKDNNLSLLIIMLSQVVLRCR